MLPKIFWTKPTLIVTFTIISWTLPWWIIELIELAKVPTKFFLPSNYLNFAPWKINKDSFLNWRCQFRQKNLQPFWTFYASFGNNTIKLSSFQQYSLYPNQSKRLVLPFLNTNSLHIFSKTLKNIATDRHVFFFVFRATGSVVSPSKSCKLLVSKTF